MKNVFGAIGNLFGKILGPLAGLFRRLGVTNNRIWLAVVYIAIALPFVAMGYELARTNWFSALIYAVIMALWAGTMWMAWYHKPTPADKAETSQIEQRMSEATPLVNDPNVHDAGELPGGEQPQRA